MKLHTVAVIIRVLFALSGILLFTFFSIFEGCKNDGKTTAPVTSSEFPQSQNEIARTSLLFAYWQKQVPNGHWAALAKADLNNDNRDDLVVVYEESANKCFFVVVEDLTTGFQLTEPTPAPIQDQVVSIMDLSGRPQHEFSISGRKGDEVGMAIFVVENHKIIMLYTSEYGDCC